MIHSDEKLSAYLDGELGADEAAKLKGALDGDPALQARLKSLGAADAAIRSACDAIDHTPMPESVLTLLKAEASDNSEQPSATVIKLTPRRAPNAVPPAWLTPLAASLALVAGVGLGAGLFTKSEPAGAIQIAGVIDPSSPLFDIIETGPSAISVQAGRVQVTPILSFRAVDGGYCREFASQDGAAGLRAIACREDTVWRVRIAVAETAGSAAVAYSPAAGANPAFEDYANRLIDGEALGAAAEARLLENGWK